ncbi:MAG: glycosyl hydrolase, partial [Myxococcota bacterium]|nr:glycosyl hydrolase [Myxococcota bacterium]
MRTPSLICPCFLSLCLLLGAGCELKPSSFDEGTRSDRAPIDQARPMIDLSSVPDRPRSSDQGAQRDQSGVYDRLVGVDQRSLRDLGVTLDLQQVDMHQPLRDRGAQPLLRKSRKRGIAYDLRSARDLEVLSAGISWWYNWSPRYHPMVSDLYRAAELDWVPMTWNGNNPDEIRAFLETHREVRYLLGYNEPNFQEQANMTPAYAASNWPTFEAIEEEYDLELVGPAEN